jgi:tetratricopeptide (TPR) repeat protein
MLKKTVILNPHSSSAYHDLGACYLDLNNYTAAEEMFKKSLDISPLQEFTIIDLIWCYRQQGKYSQMQELVKKLAAADCRNERLWGLVAASSLEASDTARAEEYFQKAFVFRLKYYNPATRHNYQRLKDIVTGRHIQLVCMQYPLREVGPLKKLFDSNEGLIFVDNERIFKDALRQMPYKDLFVDNFAGDFGHGTDKGYRLIAENVAAVLIKEYFRRPY